MILYHGSNTKGLTVLEPRLADHGRPYVYLATLEAVALFYLCNAVERPWYWFPYGFEGGDFQTPVYHELYPDALREVSEGVEGSLYWAETEETQVLPLKNIPCARLAVEPLPIAGCREVPDAYALLLEWGRQGKLRVNRYEDKTPAQLNWWWRDIGAYLHEKRMIETPDCAYAVFVREKFPWVWEQYAVECEKS